jgi:Rieske Fe-S protein
MLRGALVAGATLLLAGVGRAVSAAPGAPAASGAGFSTTPPTGVRKHNRPNHAHGAGTPTHHPAPHHTKHPRQHPTTDPTTGPSTTGPSTTGPGSTGPTTQGRPIATLDSLPVGGAVPFTGPGGQPCALFRLGQSDVAAFSRICTHAGCVVGYDQSAKLLVCPCHGAEFDPSQGAAPVSGPAPTPLESIRVVVDKGEVVLPS